LAVAAAESAFAGNLGAEISLSAIKLAATDGESTTLPGVENVDDYWKLFSESNSRFLIEVPVEKSCAFEGILCEAKVPFARIGKVVEKPELTIFGADGSVAVQGDLADLKLRWQKPFDLGGWYAD
jgi:phosphoribosylformylglycinamidine synthase